MAFPAWQYDGLRHSRVDDGDPSQAAVYDERHQRFRDYRKDAEAILGRRGVKPGNAILNMGTGTGAFALHDAPKCATVFAADVSRAMLDCCHQKAEAQNVRNIVFRQGGFLTYQHDAVPVNIAVSTAVPHHIPDFWKFFGLRRLTRMIKPGGWFYLFDIVFRGADPEIGGGSTT